ncbi:MAG: prolipoprotein diacylglyceryl transferase [Deltaproteobacteria bacterium]|nr:prolipoprotein diacylglyceryl transferase [Deltaproteobacteria bacterium]
MRARLAEAIGLDPNGIASMALSQPAALVAGFAISVWLVLLLAQREHFDRRPVAELLIAAYAGALTGGRALDALAWGSAFWREPWRVLDPWFGGASTLGGLIGGALATAIWARRLRLDGIRFLDAIAPVAGITVACFKIGCLLAGCCFGARSHSVFAVRFPASSMVYQHQLAAGLIDQHYRLSLPVHPVQAYEAAWGLAVAALLLALRRRLQPRIGARVALAAALLLVGRLAIEFLRAPVGSRWLGLSSSQLASVAGLAALAWLALHRTGRARLLAWFRPPPAPPRSPSG